MNPQTLNAINAGLAATWLFLSWTCTVLAALLSGGFIAGCLGGALWQLAAEAWQGLQHFHLTLATISGPRTRRALRVLLVCGCVTTAALAQRPARQSAQSAGRAASGL